MTVAELPITATLTRQGKTATLVFDAELAEALGVEPGGQVRITRQGKQIIIEAAPAVDRSTQLQAAVAQSHARYAEAYRKLAE